MHLHLEHTDFIRIIFLACAYELNLVAWLDRAVDNLEICNDTSERVEYRVKDKRLKRSLRVSLRSRHSLNDSIQDFLHTLSSLT